MRIAVIGAGAMGSIYGGHLSTQNEVFLIDKNPELVRVVQEKGLIIEENGKKLEVHPNIVSEAGDIGPVDLIVLFVKSLYSRAALTENKSLIGENTYVLTLQNGSGHEDILSEYVPLDRIIIGTTEDNGAMPELGKVRHGGTGRTNLGMLSKTNTEILNTLKQVFDSCGFDTLLHDNIQQLIWNKLFTNISLSAVTGVLQVQMGYIAKNEHAWALTTQLLKEAVTVAHAMGLEADEDKLLEEVKSVSVNNPEGCTSIYTDLKCGRRTEVDNISGSVIRAAKKQGVAVPAHEFLVHMVHALEEK